MTEPLVVVTPRGIRLPDADVYLDARNAPGTVFVSHAHADHCSDAPHILCTPETAALHRARHGCQHAETVPFNEPALHGAASLTLQPAGHVLGSAMLITESARGRVAYTGDFKLRPNPFAPPVSIPSCDVLVMECTFGEPRYVFPPQEEVLDRLAAFIDETRAARAVPVVLAYAFGKAQEILYHLTARGYDVVVHGAIARLCDLHVELGYPFPGPGRWFRYRRGEIGDRVLLTTPHTRNTPMVERIANRRVCLLTGWALHPGAHNMYRDCDLVLPYSDHADWPELVRMATESGAREVYTVHGHGGLARYLREQGIEAEHLADHPSFADVEGEGGEDEPAVETPPPVQPELPL